MNASKSSPNVGWIMPRKENQNLQMEGLSPSLKLFNELMRGWNGFILTGDEAYEGSNELLRSPRLVNPKSYVNLSKTT